MYILVIKQLIIMLLIAISGFIVTKKFKFGAKEQKFVSTILIYFINPCLIVSHFNMEFNAERLKALGLVFLLSVVIHFVLILLAMILLRKNPVGGKDYISLERLSVVFTNCAFIGIPLISGVFPDSNGVFYLLAFIMTFNIFLWTFGYYSVCGKIHVKKVVTNPNIVALFIGLAVFCCPVKLPQVLSKSMEMIASLNTALAMFLLGMLFTGFKAIDKTLILRVVRVCIIKDVVAMLVVLAVLYGAFRLFANVDEIRLMCYVCYIAALCPVGMSVSSFAVLFNKDESYSGLLVLVTSVICVVTLPLSVALAEKIF
ncbi:MAG: AEC family transporter [Treponema sp.]|nr:AEC family transporter [Treponema sp.]